MVCANFLLWSIGDCGTANKITINNDLVQQLVTNVMISNKNLLDIHTTTSNVTNILSCPGSLLDCGPDGLNVNQITNSQQYVINDFNEVTSGRFISELNTAIQNSVNQMTKDVRDFLAAEPSGRNEADLITKIQNLISTTFNKDNLNSIRIETADVNTTNLTVCGTIRASACNITQQIQVNTFVNNVMNSLTTIITKDTVVTSVINDIIQYLESITKGLGDILAWIALIIVALIAGVILFLLLGGRAMLSDPKKLIMYIISFIIIVVIVYFALAFWRKWWPFKPKPVKALLAQDPKLLALTGSCSICSIG